ncbi:hypothetical protein GTPT_3214 [Tatumella ptyseos ATCC 33301]|uniref:Wzy n=3 Tax=Tatumella ptyseos TaxID=82987 RepID=A0A085JA81_9GAMM|nr:hypothetical protein GTPT_3214 [Tatumella ptyseos ATCC 33301]
MISESKKFKLSVLFFSFYFIYSFKTVLLSTSIQDDSIDILKNFFNILSIILSIVSLIYIGNKERIVISLIGAFLVINYALYHTVALYSYFILFCMVSLTKKIEFRTILKIILSSNILIIILMMPFIAFSHTFYRMDDRFGERLTLGFGNANVMAQFLIMMFSMAVLFIFNNTKGKSIKNLYLIISFALISIVVYESGSRTGLAMITLSFLGFLWALNTKQRNVSKKFKKIYCLGVILIILFQLYTVTHFNENAILITLNQALAGRVFYSYNLFSAMGVMPFLHGLNIDAFMPVDFYFIQYFYSLGLFLGLAFIYLYYREFNNGEYSKPAAIVLLTCLIATATESYFMIPLYNLSLFMVFYKKIS